MDTHYTEINRINIDQIKRARAAVKGEPAPLSECITVTGTETIRLDIIRRITDENTGDEEPKLSRIIISEDHTEDIIVRREEADAIKKTLLTKDGVALYKAVDSLTRTIRDLYNLLRARMH